MLVLWVVACYAVRADANLVKDVLTCHPLVPSMYKSHHPDDTDEPGDVGGSSEDEATGMEEVLGITRRLHKPSPAQPSPASPAPEPTSPVLDDETTVRVPKKDLKQAAKLLQDLSAGKRVRIPARASRDEVPFEVPFEVPDVGAGDTNCALCCQSFKSTRSLRQHMKMHTGETGHSCQCGKILASRAMLELHEKSCGKEKGHWCRACSHGYRMEQALVHHLKAKHGPALTKEELTCTTCEMEFKVVKTMWGHLASHKGPFYCQVPGCGVGPFSLPKWLN